MSKEGDVIKVGLGQEDSPLSDKVGLVALAAMLDIVEALILSLMLTIVIEHVLQGGLRTSVLKRDRAIVTKFCCSQNGK